MACGSCAERARARQEAAAAAAVSGSGTAKTSQATYTVIHPDGSTTSFTYEQYGVNAYLEAQTHRRRVNGTLTTST